MSHSWQPLCCVSTAHSLLLQGLGKRVPISAPAFVLSRTRTKGKRAIRLAADDRLASLQVVDPARHEQVLLGSQGGQMIRVALQSIPIQSHRTGGLRMAKLAPADVITSCTPLPSRQD